MLFKYEQSLKSDNSPLNLFKRHEINRFGIPLSLCEGF